jgi:uncharacterized protein (TIGR03382 family)
MAVLRFVAVVLATLRPSARLTGGRKNLPVPVGGTGKFFPLRERMESPVSKAARDSSRRLKPGRPLIAAAFRFRPGAKDISNSADFIAAALPLLGNAAVTGSSMNILSETTGAARTAALVLLLNFGHAAIAAPLPPGSTIALEFEHEPVGGRLLAVTNVGFHIPGFDGRLISKVWADDAANPWGGLTFAYKLAGVTGCQDFPTVLSLGGFEGSLVDASYFGSGRVPCAVSRSESGDQIEYDFTKVRRHGASSAWLVLQTGCGDWSTDSQVEINSEIVSVSTFAPVTAPEPTPAVLTGAGLLTVWLGRRRRG